MGYMPPKMFVTTDSVAVAFAPPGGLRLLFIQRANDPCKGRWALPGGFVELDEDLPDACARELMEETGLQPTAMAQIGAWGTPGRDPRGRNVTVAYLVLVAPGQDSASAGDDAAGAQWFPADELPALAFDHADIVRGGLDLLRVLAGRTCAALALLPESCGLAELRAVLSAVHGRDVSEQETRSFAGAAGLKADARGRCRRPDGGFLAPLSGA